MQSKSKKQRQTSDYDVNLPAAVEVHKLERSPELSHSAASLQQLRADVTQYIQAC
jgi:hypothetical protein